MCMDSPTMSVMPPPRPAGAGFTVADVDKGTSKYRKVYEGDQDVTDNVEVDSATNRYVKKRTTNSAIDSYAGM